MNKLQSIASVESCSEAIRSSMVGARMIRFSFNFLSTNSISGMSPKLFPRHIINPTHLIKTYNNVKPARKRILIPSWKRQSQSLKFVCSYLLLVLEVKGEGGGQEKVVITTRFQPIHHDFSPPLAECWRTSTKTSSRSMAPVGYPSHAVYQQHVAIFLEPMLIGK